jgi:hypothetical protein
MAVTDTLLGGRSIREGTLPVPIVLSAAVEVGDLLASSGGTWVQADANAGLPARLIAASAGASGATIIAYAAAVVDVSSGSGDLTVIGDEIGLSDTVGEIVIQSTGTTPQEQSVGFAASSTEDTWIFTGGLQTLGRSFEDNAMLQFGDRGDLRMRWDGTDLDVLVAGTNSQWIFGDDTTLLDVKFQGDTTANFAMWDASADMFSIQGGASFVKGHTAPLTSLAAIETQIIGQSNGVDDGVLIANFVANTTGPFIRFLKSRSTTPGAFGIVVDDDVIGSLQWYGDDAVDYGTAVAEINAEGDGTMGTGDIPGRLTFSTGDGGTLTERLRISSTGRISLGEISDGLGQLHLVQDSLTGAIPALYIRQDDLDVGFVNFVSTATADVASPISTHGTSGATTDHIRVQVNGANAWIAVSTNNPSA